MCSQTGQNGLVDVVAHQDAAGDAAALEQAVDVAYVLLVENGDHQIVAVAVGDIDGKSDVIIEKLRARDRVFILRGGQIDDEKAKDLALLSHKVTRSRIWEKLYSFTMLSTRCRVFSETLGCPFRTLKQWFWKRAPVWQSRMYS